MSERIAASSQDGLRIRFLRIELRNGNTGEFMVDAG